jgi:REP element-mobilizing transposase RayT
VLAQFLDWRRRPPVLAQFVQSILPMDPIYFYRRDLPHWRLLGSCYFLTFRLRRRQPSLGFEERTLVQETILARGGLDYALDAHVVMDDHVHALCRPLRNIPLEKILHSWKSVSAFKLQRSMGRRGAIWQREWFDRIVRDEAEWLEKIQYIAGNPLKRWPGCLEYRWVMPKL